MTNTEYTLDISKWVTELKTYKNNIPTLEDSLIGDSVYNMEQTSIQQVTLIEENIIEKYNLNENQKII